MTKPTRKNMLQAGRKGTSSSTRPRVSVLAGEEKGHSGWKCLEEKCCINKKISPDLRKLSLWTTYSVCLLTNRGFQNCSYSNQDAVLWSHCSGHDTIFIIKCESREARHALHLIYCGCEAVLLAYLLLWLSGEHKAWLIKPIRTHQSSSGHTTLQSVAVVMRGTQPMDQSKHSHQGHSSSQAFRE